MIRALTPDDLFELRILHERYFAKEFELPDFMQFICAFVIEDEKGIVTIGGIRDIPECIAVTNMDRSVKDRVKALLELLRASCFVCKQTGYDQMYVWSQNSKYTSRLLRSDFRLPRGQSLILDLEE